MCRAPFLSIVLVASLVAADATAADRVVVMSSSDSPVLGVGELAGATPVTGRPGLDAACRDVGVVAVEPYYPGRLRRPYLAAVAARLRVLRLAAGVDPGAVIARLTGMPGLDAVAVAAPPRLRYSPDDAAYQFQWHLPHVGAEAAWDIIRGDATRVGVVAVIDTGLDIEHPEFLPNLWINGAEDLDGNQRLDASDLDGIDQDGNGFVDDVCGWNFIEDQPRPTGPLGHANGVASSVSEATDNGLAGAGLGFGVRLMPLQVISGAAYLDGYIAMLYAADNGAGVINCSWGVPVHAAYQQAIVDAVWAEDVVIVAAGGDGTVVDYPAGYEHVVGVSSTDQDDHKAPFGPWGEAIDICAPAVNILVIYDSDLTWVSGTSFATGMVSGLSGLVRAAAPMLPASEVVDVLMETAVDIDAVNPAWAGQLGAGRIDAAAAVAAAAGITAASTGSSAPTPPALRCAPNPFNATTEVSFRLRRDATLALEAFDLRGRRVASLAHGTWPAGRHTVIWHADRLASGAYLIRLRGGGVTVTARVVLAR